MGVEAVSLMRILEKAVKTALSVQQGQESAMLASPRAAVSATDKPAVVQAASMHHNGNLSRESGLRELHQAA
jgi:hypothetical protein